MWGRAVEAAASDEAPTSGSVGEIAAFERHGDDLRLQGLLLLVVVTGEPLSDSREEMSSFRLEPDEGTLCGRRRR